MTYHLVVAKPFLNFSRGDIITDPVLIATVLSDERRGFVRQIMAPNLKG